jgi:hypothetical protein
MESRLILGHCRVVTGEKNRTGPVLLVLKSLYTGKNRRGHAAFTVDKIDILG